MYGSVFFISALLISATAVGGASVSGTGTTSTGTGTTKTGMGTTFIKPMKQFNSDMATAFGSTLQSGTDDFNSGLKTISNTASNDPHLSSFLSMATKGAGKMADAGNAFMKAGIDTASGLENEKLNLFEEGINDLTNGFTNGFTNGLTSGLTGLTGLTNGFNGLTNGFTGLTNGFTNSFANRR